MRNDPFSVTEFDRRFAQHRKWMKYFGCAFAALWVLLTVGAVIGVGYLLFHPSVVGQFFGQIVSGFNASSSNGAAK